MATRHGVGMSFGWCVFEEKEMRSIKSGVTYQRKITKRRVVVSTADQWGLMGSTLWLVRMIRPIYKISFMVVKSMAAERRSWAAAIIADCWHHPRCVRRTAKQRPNLNWQIIYEKLTDFPQARTQQLVRVLRTILPWLFELYETVACREPCRPWILRVWSI